MFEILAAYGARVLARFVLLAVLFLVLHLLRVLLHALVCGLTALMRGVDRAAVSRLASATPRTAYSGAAYRRPAWGRAAA